MNARGLPAWIGWAALTAVSSGAWYLTATRVAFRLGSDAAAPGVGAAVALVVAATLWRWAASDRRDAALGAGRCPRCGGAVVPDHRHARPGVLEAGLTEWRCARCTFAHAEPLTCEWCRP